MAKVMDFKPVVKIKGTEQIYVVEQGVDKRLSTEQLKEFINSDRTQINAKAIDFKW